jgi:hypothetical protein
VVFFIFGRHYEPQAKQSRNEMRAYTMTSENYDWHSPQNDNLWQAAAPATMVRWAM